ncbi:MAG: hypothetical protein RL007_389 [Bacteroidota bacterium]|jgi:hypothetical protein
MKTVNAILATALILISASCGTTQKHEEVVAADSSVPVHVDTSFVFLHNNDSCELLLAKRESIENNGVITEKIFTWITRGQDTVFRASYNFNTIGAYEVIGSSRSYFQLINDGGGSGYTGVLLYLNTSRKEPFVDAISDISELSKWIYSADGNSVLMAHGLWTVTDMDAPDAETHFSAHRQVLFLYDINVTPRTEKELGATKNKYELIDGENSFEDMRKSESQFDTLVAWEKFGIGKQ